MRTFFSKIWLFLSLPFLFFLTGQIPDQGNQSAKGLLKASQKSWAEGHFDQALSLSIEAKKQAKAETDTLSLIMAMRQIGKYYARNGYTDQATVMLDSVISLANWIGPLHHEIFLARGERADVEARIGEFDRCIKRYEEILRDCKTLSPNDTLRPIMFQWAGQAYSYIEAYDSALHYCHRSLELFEKLYPSGSRLDIAYVENALGVIYSNIDRQEESVRHYQRAEEILSRLLRPGHAHVLQVRSNAAVQYQAMGQPWKAMAQYQKNLPYIDSVKPAIKYATLFNYAGALNNIGDCYESLKYLDQAEAIIREWPNLQPGGLNRIYYTRSAALQGLKRYEEALRYIRMSIETDVKVYGKDNSHLVQNYSRLGMISLLMGNYAEAVAAQKQAIRIADLQLAPYSMRKAWAWEALGEAQAKMGEHRQAIQSLHTAEKIYINGKMEWNLVDTYRNIAVAWQHLGNQDSTLLYFQKSWKTAMPGLPFQLSPDSLTYHHWRNAQLPALFEDLAGLNEWLYEHSPEKKHIAARLACLEAYIAVADSQQYYFESAESRQTQAADQRRIVEQALSSCLLLFRETGGENYVKKAFQLAEQSKAGQLRNHLQSRQALRFAGIPDSLVMKERDFRERLFASNMPHIEEDVDNNQKAARMREIYYRISREYRLFLQKLEKDHPEYYRLKYPVRLTVEDVSAKIEPQQALFSYFQEEDRIFVFRFSEGHWYMDYHTFPELLYLVSTWRKFISSPPPTEYSSLSDGGSVITQYLLPGLSSAMKHLIIIPDGILGYLPFESLLLEKVKPAREYEYRNWPFLARYFTFTYTNNAAIWLQYAKESSPEAHYIGFAPAFTENNFTSMRGAPDQLKYNQDEVIQVARLLHGKALTGANAKESAVKNLGDDPQILHFATHAMADDHNPMSSKLYFGQPVDSTEDNILYAWEIFGLDLNSPLTVLSACQTGDGLLQRGEGIMSLARAFQYSGSQNVLTTLWQTDDRAGAAITTSFFQKMAEGSFLENALTQAKTNWLDKSDNYHCHPYFWAGYILIGDGGNIQMEESRFWMNTGIFATFFLVAIVIFLIFRRKNKNLSL